MIFDQDLDESGGPVSRKRKKNGQNTRRYLFGAGLIDIWRVRNPTEKRFTWRQKTPIIQRRLDLVRVS